MHGNRTYPAELNGEYYRFTSEADRLCWMNRHPGSAVVPPKDTQYRQAQNSRRAAWVGYPGAFDNRGIRTPYQKLIIRPCEVVL